VNDSPADGERLSALLWRAARASTRFYQAQLTEFDLTPRQATAILSLIETPGVTLGTLAEALRADQATASAVVDRLLAAELVRRETDPADRRRARLYATKKALLIAEQVAEARRRTDDLIEDVLGRQASKELKKVLTRLSERLEQNALPVPSGSSA
jgi:DNA-binding MarR family transcriptional regulator